MVRPRRMTTEQEKLAAIKNGKYEIAGLRYMIDLALANDDCIAKLIIDGKEHPFSSSQIFIPIIKAEIEEIQKCIDGKPNKWE